MSSTAAAQHRYQYNHANPMRAVPREYSLRPALGGGIAHIAPVELAECLCTVHCRPPLPPCQGLMMIPS